MLKGLYALEIGQLAADDVLKSIVLDKALSSSAAAFAELLFAHVQKHHATADEYITRLATNWKLERIAVIDRIILRMAIVELRESIDVPVKVVLNEAIELAKLYSTSESSGFINGILDSYVKETSEAG